MKTWQVQEAKARFSELLALAEREGPQTITRHGKARAVLMSMDEFAALTKEKDKEKPNLVDVLFHAGPKFDDFEIERDKDTGREIDLE